MTALHLLPVALGLLLLAAHSLRAGCLPMVVALLALCLLLALRRPWVATLTQGVLVVGAAEWLRTLVVLAHRRAAAGEPAIRMALILGAVAVFTLASAAVFRSRTLRRFYRLGGGPDADSADQGS